MFALACVSGKGANDKAVVNKEVWESWLAEYEETLSPIEPGDGPFEWTVLVTVNSGFFPFFVNWMWHYEALGLDYSVVVIAEDELAEAQLQAFQRQHPLIAKIHASGLGIEGIVTYKSNDYKQMVAQRAAYILWALEQYEHVIYNDLDTVWLSDPTEHFPRGYEMYIQLEFQRLWTSKRTRELEQRQIWPEYCTGLIGMHRTSWTLKLLRMWDKWLINAPQLNQPAFNKALVRLAEENKGLHTCNTDVRPQAVFGGPANQTCPYPVGCTDCWASAVYTLPSTTFPNGKHYFEQMTNTERQDVVVVHNNFISGGPLKCERFREHGLWAPTLPKCAFLRA
jgi:hypothetical protein